jgi:hypothetical protein
MLSHCENTGKWGLSPLFFPGNMIAAFPLHRVRSFTTSYTSLSLTPLPLYPFPSAYCNWFIALPYSSYPHDKAYSSSYTSLFLIPLPLYPFPSAHYNWSVALPNSSFPYPLTILLSSSDSSLSLIPLPLYLILFTHSI